MKGEVVIANGRDLCHGRRRQRGPRDPESCRRARAARPRSHGSLHRYPARDGGEAGASRKFSDRVDRDRRIEARRAAPDSFDTPRIAVERVAGGTHAGPSETRGGFFDRRICRGTGPVGGSLEAAAGGGHGAQRRAWIYAPAAGSFRGAGAGLFSRNRALVSERPHRSDRTSGTRGIFCDPSQATRRDADGPDHRREPGLAHAESGGGRKLVPLV